MVGTTKQFTENTDQHAGTNYSASQTLSGNFLDCSDEDAHSNAQKEFGKAQAQNIEELGRSFREGNLDLSQISCNAVFANATNHKNQVLLKENKEKRTADTVFLALLDQIKDLESYLAATYGENFAEDMVEELHQNGKISDEERDRIMAIEDVDERRQAIAELIQDKMRSGEITAADLDDYQWAQEWLSLHANAIEQRNQISNDVEIGKRSMEGAPKEAIDHLEGKMAAEGKDMAMFKSSTEQASQHQVESAQTSSHDFDAFT